MTAGKILSYHPHSFHEYEKEEPGLSISPQLNGGNSNISVTSASVTSSMVTPVVSNSYHRGESNAQKLVSKQKQSLTTSCTSNTRLIQLSSIILLATCMVLVGLSRFHSADNGYAHRIETIVVKNTDITDYLNEDAGYELVEQTGGGKVTTNQIQKDLESIGLQLEGSRQKDIYESIMNVDHAIHEASSASQVMFWEPSTLGTLASSSNVMIDNMMNVASQCFDREVVTFGSYELQSTERESILSDQQQQSQTRPLAIFASSFHQAATTMELFDSSNQKVAIAILPNPIDAYLPYYNAQKEDGPTNSLSDNLIIRSLLGIEQENRKVDDNDFYAARQILRSKFFICSCEYPTDTLKRLIYMMDTDGISKTEVCRNARQKWNQECRARDTQRERNFQTNQELMGYIQSEHHYDIQLYEDSKTFFLEETNLFPSDLR